MNFNFGVGALVIIILLVGVLFVSLYNKFVRENEMVSNAMGQIAAQLQSRWDALNNLIDATKDYAKFESETLDKVTKNRTGVTKNSSTEDVKKDDADFDRALKSVYLVAENYPNLRASEVYQNTMNSINKYEDNVRHSRMIYNDTVTKFNRDIKSFPANLIAGTFGFHEKDYFTNEANTSEVPRFNRD